MKNKTCPPGADFFVAVIEGALKPETKSVNANSDKWISRKEIAIELNMTPEAVRKNEPRYGLDKIKVQQNARVILFPRQPAISAIRRLFPRAFATC